MTEKSPSSNIDPQLRERLWKESKSPYKGLRRVFWFAFLGSSFLGLFIMSIRAISGSLVTLNDALIQVCALFLFAFLLYFDRPKDN